MTRLGLAIRATLLYESGLTQEQVAKRMGISRTYAASLITDPDGSKEAARKARYTNRCVDCGAVVGRDVARCPLHAALYRIEVDQERSYTKADVAEAFQRWEEEHGDSPRQKDWHRAKIRPTPVTVYRLYGSWAGAIVEVFGRPNHRRDQPGHVYPPTPTVAETAPGTSYSHEGIEEEVCPNCGAFVRRLIEFTGWCARCTRIQTKDTKEGIAA